MKKIIICKRVSRVHELSAPLYHRALLGSMDRETRDAVILWFREGNDDRVLVTTKDMIVGWHVYEPCVVETDGPESDYEPADLAQARARIIPRKEACEELLDMLAIRQSESRLHRPPNTPARVLSFDEIMKGDFKPGDLSFLGIPSRLIENVRHPAEEALYGMPIFFSGARIYRPKDGVMVVTNPSGLIGSKSSIGLHVVMRAAEKEKRELIVISSFYEDPKMADAVISALERHGLQPQAIGTGSKGELPHEE